MNIPIYRAKKIDSDEVMLYDTDELSVGKCNELLQDGWIDTKQDKYFRKNKNDEWVEGFLTKGMIDDFYIENDFETGIQIYPNTLAIHFPNMIDKNGKKIFASLSGDGVGGDIALAQKAKGIIKIDNSDVIIFGDDGYARLSELNNNLVSVEVIGIHKG